MSTFTEFNGPQQGMTGPTLSQLTAMIEAYNKLSTQLQAHVEKAVSEVSDVHNVKAYVDHIKATITSAYTLAINTQVQGINEQIDLIEDSIDTKADATTVTTQLETISNSINELQTLVDTLVDTDDFNNAINNINSSLATIQEALDDFVAHWSIDEDDATFDGTLKADEVTAKVKALNSVDYVKWSEFQAPFAGTGGQDASTQGVYVLGCLSEDWSEDANPPANNTYKPSRIYVKYLNSEPFDAIIDVAVMQKDNVYAGTLTAKVAKEAGTWEDMAFHIVRGTGTQGQEQVDKMYLCISSKGLAIEHDIGGTVAVTQATFKVVGENFCAVGQEGYVRPNGMLHNITTSKIGTDASNAIAIDNLIAKTITTDEMGIDAINDTEGKRLFQVERQPVPDHGEIVVHRYMFVGNADYDKMVISTRPYLLTRDDQDNVHQSRFVTLEDVTDMTVPVGGIIRWVNMDRLPVNYTACDGSTVSAGDYPELAEVIGDGGSTITLPLEEHSIIKYSAGNIDEVIDPTPNFVSLDTLDVRINEEVDRATAAEATLQSNIATEQARAESAESDLADAIDAEQDRAETEEAALNTAIQSEVARATAAEETNADAIDAVDDKADANAAAITAERTRAMAAEETIDDKADAAVDEADAATTAVQAEVTRATTAEQLLNDRISAYHPGDNNSGTNSQPIPLP